MEIVMLDDGKEYREYSVTELEKEKLNAEIQRQLSTGRFSVTKHDIFTMPSNSRTGRKMPR